MGAGAERKRKQYTALCWAAEPQTAASLQAKLGAVAELQVTQRTPMRVLHRRALMDRTKVREGGRDYCRRSESAAWR
jgi:tRNA U54 and U55 pseudouridine synthase Pus10